MTGKAKRLTELMVLIRGAGEMASGVAHRLARSRFRVVMTELEKPLAIRREISFCEAVYRGAKEVEGITARIVSSISDIEPAWKMEEIPVLIDPLNSAKAELKPDVLVDAVMAKINTGTSLEDARLVIAMGPGFTAGKDAHVVVETNRGHNLGRLILAGQAEPDTGVPAQRMGFAEQRVLRAPKYGVFRATKKIGDAVKAGEVVCAVDDVAVTAAIDGVLRGILMDDLSVGKGLKIGDIDPRGDVSHCFTISDKARALGGAVLEGILMHFNY